jgi:hypothetical protein
VGSLFHSPICGQNAQKRMVWFVSVAENAKKKENAKKNEKNY